jgi:putative peptidoglycan lipid II flippase
MNAPYDGDRGREAAADGYPPSGPPPAQPAAPQGTDPADQYPADAYGQGGYPRPQPYPQGSPAHPGPADQHPRQQYGQHQPYDRQQPQQPAQPTQQQAPQGYGPGPVADAYAPFFRDERDQRDQRQPPASYGRQAPPAPQQPRGAQAPYTPQGGQPRQAPGDGRQGFVPQAPQGAQNPQQFDRPEFDRQQFGQQEFGQQGFDRQDYGRQEFQPQEFGRQDVAQPGQQGQPGRPGPQQYGQQGFGAAPQPWPAQQPPPADRPPYPGGPYGDPSYDRHGQPGGYGQPGPGGPYGAPQPGQPYGPGAPVPPAQVAPEPGQAAADQGLEATGTTQALGAVTAEAPAARSGGGRAGSLLKSSAVMAAGTLVSRVTGFLRTLVMASAIGVGTLNDGYQVANTLPTMIYILVGGGALNAVFIPQLVRAMKTDEDGGEAYANRLLTLVVVGLAAVTTVCVIGAPVFIQLMSHKIASDPVKMSVAVTFARYCIPTMFFMGIHVVMGQVLNARGRFGAMMWTPVLNNIVIIATFGAYIWAFGSFSHTGVDSSTITPQGVRLLGVGTLLGLTVQALSMIPYMREAGFKLRPRFDWRGHGLGHAAKLAKWTFFFVLANQLGMVVLTQFATAAGSAAGHEQGTGITAFNYALLLWQMPQAIITVSVMTAVLPRISRAASDGDSAAVRDDLSYGLRTSGVAIVPCAFAFLALGVPLATLLYAGSGENGALNIGFTLMAFGLGLIPFSIQYIVLRGFYAYEDTRTPFYNTVIVAASNAAGAGLCYLVLPARWAVVGMAACYGLAYALGVGVAVKRLSRRLGGDLDGKRVVRTYARLIGACVPAAAVAGLAVYAVARELGHGPGASLLSLVLGGALLLGVFVVTAKRMRIEEMTAMVGMVRGRLGR